MPEPEIRCPLLFHFLDAIGHTDLGGSKPDSLHDDLFDRWINVIHAAQVADFRPEATRLRISYCCGRAGKLFLAPYTGLGEGLDPMKFRATHVQLRAVNSALAMVKKTLHIDRAEVVMGDEEAQRSASQLFFSTISKQTTLLGDLEAILVLAEEYLNGQQAAAGEVGRQFLTFLADGVVPWIDEAVVLARIHA